MDKKEIVLVALSASNGALHTPVQIQKLLFLIDKKVDGLPGAPYFNFTAYDYGPFDKEIYSVLGQLGADGDVEILQNPVSRLSQYRLSSQGQTKGQELLEALDQEKAGYIKELSQYVRSLSFAELVSAIYREFPEMKVNSVFRG